LYGGANVSTQINCWGDVDWGGDVQIHWSTIKYYVFIFGNVVISIQSWKQKTFTIFSTKAKYNFVTSVVKECIWLCQLLVNLSCHQSSFIIIFCDNQSSILLFKDPKFHNRLKHIDIRYHELHRIEIGLYFDWMNEIKHPYIASSFNIVAMA
jgi:hypothetical protein